MTPSLDQPPASWEQIELGAHPLGLPRLADVTGLDRLGIPGFAAIAATRAPDVLSVYNGKGRNEEQARAGALLELIERRSAQRRRRKLLRATWDELRSSGRAALAPD